MLAKRWEWKRACARWGRAVAVAAAMTGCVRAGCAADDPARHASEREEIVVGVANPFLVRGLLRWSDSGEVEGFAVDVAKEAASAVGLKCRFIPLIDEKPLVALESGRVDVEAAVSIMESRLERVEYTSPILITRGVVFRRRETDVVTSPEGLRGRGVAVAQSGIANQWCRERGILCAEYSSLAESLTAVAEGKADYAVTTQIAGRVEVERCGLKNLTWDELEDDRFCRAFAMAVRSGNHALTTEFNRGLKIISDNGTYDRLYDRWVARYQSRPAREASVHARVAAWVSVVAVALGLAGAVWHVTLRRALSRRTRDLREREAQYGAIAANVPGLVYTYFVGADGKRERRFGNQRLAEWKRDFPCLDPGADYRVSMREQIHPDDVAGYDAATERAREGPSVFDAQFRLRDASGAYRWLHSIVVPVSAGGGVLWQGLILDVTAVREAEAELSRSRRRYQEIFDRSHDAILVFRPEDRVVLEANERACEMYGYPREELIGMSLRRVTVDAEAGERRIADTLAEGGLRNAQFRQRSRDGRLIDVDVSASAIEYDGRPAILTLNRDVTERVRAEEERRQMESRLQQAERLESLGLLAGGIAHDFNNLLVGILGNAELIPMVAGNAEETTRLTGQIVLSAQRAGDLTQQLLAYAGRARLASESVNLEDIGREMVSVLGARVSAEATVEFCASPDGARTTGDTTQLRQVVMNLLTNASDALMGERGRITVRTGNGVFDRAQLGDPGAEPGRYSYVEVEDDGCGMDDATARRMFDPFFTTKPAGRGLGLAATLRTVQRHRGAISVRSTPKKGTVIRVFLPWSPCQRGTVEPKALASARRGSVLIVDDEPAIREVTEKLLRSLGWTVGVAPGGDAALEFLRQDRPADVVLMDLTMPGLSGSRLVSEIRRLRPGAPIVVMTGYSVEAGGTGAPLHADGHVAKPFRVEALDAELTRVLAERGAGVGAPLSRAAA